MNIRISEIIKELRSEGLFFFLSNIEYVIKLLRQGMDNFFLSNALGCNDLEF